MYEERYTISDKKIARFVNEINYKSKNEAKYANYRYTTEGAGEG